MRSDILCRRTVGTNDSPLASNLFILEFKPLRDCPRCPLSDPFTENIHDREQRTEHCQYRCVDGEAAQETSFLDPRSDAEGHAETNNTAETGDIDKHWPVTQYVLA